MVSHIFYFHPIWGRFPFWLIFFRWVETTNQYSSNLECLQFWSHGGHQEAVLQTCFTPGNLEQVEHPQIIKPSVAFCNIYIIYTDNIYVLDLYWCVPYVHYAFRPCAWRGVSKTVRRWRPNLSSKKGRSLSNYTVSTCSAGGFCWLQPMSTWCIWTPFFSPPKRNSFEPLQKKVVHLLRPPTWKNPTQRTRGSSIKPGLFSKVPQLVS